MVTTSENSTNTKISSEERSNDLIHKKAHQPLDLIQNSVDKPDTELNKPLDLMQEADDETLENAPPDDAPDESIHSFAALNVVNQGTVQELPGDGYSASWGAVNSVERNLGLQGNLFSSLEDRKDKQDISSFNGFIPFPSPENYFPVAPDINFFRPESFLRTSSSTTLEGNVFDQGANAGQDGLSSIDVNGDAQGYQKSFIPGGIIITTPEGNTLTLYTQDQPTLNIRIGDYVYTLNSPITHASSALEVMDIIHPDTGEPIQIFIEPFTYTIIDSNGDSVTGKIVAQIIDDAPSAIDLAPAPIDESNISSADSLPGGTNQATVSAEISGSLIDFVGNYFGADGGLVTRVSIENEISNVTANGVITVTTREGNVLVVNQATGAYTYTLSNPINNNNHQNASGDEALEVFDFELTDNDQDVVVANLTITVMDDVPVATDIEVGSLDESNLGDGINPGTAPLTLTGFLVDGIDNQFGADGGEVTMVEIDGGNTDYSDPDVIITTTAEGNTLSVNRSTGAYTYTLLQPIDHVNGNDVLEVFRYQFTDEDGDQANAELTVTIADDAPVAANVLVQDLYENNLADGTNPDANQLTRTGVIMDGTNNKFGADGGVVSSVTIAGQTSNTIVNGIIIVLTAEGNRLEVNQATGEYTYYLNSAVDHDPTQNTATDTFVFTLTDGDGSTASANLVVNIIDDVPEANDINGGTFNQGNLPGGSDPSGTVLQQSGSLFNDHPNNALGADGAVVNSITYHGSEHTAVNGTITVTTTEGNVLTVNANNGQYTYTFTNPVDHENHETNGDGFAIDRFTYELRDSDGDTASADLTILIEPDVIPPIANPDNFEFGAELGKINLVLALDYSGSMIGAPIAALKAFVAGSGGLIDTYASLSNEITITVILFNGAIVGQLTSDDIDDVKDLINGFGAGGGTNFNFPMQAAYTALTNAPDDAKNIFYFVTDGQGTSPSDAFYNTQWYPLLDDKDIDSIAVSVGSSTNMTALSRIANPDDDPLVRSTDGALADIEDVLLTDTQQITGNILSDDDPGNGSTPIVSAFSQNSNEGTIGVAFTTANGATITVLADGTFVYEASLATLRNSYTETFSYTITNSSGTDTSSFTINVTGAAPVVIDMNGDGVLEVSSISEGIMYDIDGDGIDEQTSWVGANDGILAFDFQGDGQVTDAKEFVFTMWDENAQTDMEALRNVFDTNGDGALTNEDEGWAQFGIWQDKNGNGLSDEGEFFTLDELGFKRLDLLTNEEIQHLNASTSHGVSQLHHKEGYSLNAHDVSLKYVDIIVEESLFQNEPAPQGNASHSSSSDLPPLATNDSDFSSPSQEANLAYEMEMQQQNTESLG